MKKHTAFTMIELVFVIVVMGIIGKFGTEFLAQAYKSFIFSNVNNHLQEKSAFAVEFISSRLQYRIKDSVIVRESIGGNYDAIGNADSNKDYYVLEWIQSDADSFRGTTKPLWSGIADLDAGSASTVVSPETNTSAVNDEIQIYSYSNSGVNNGALYFVGSGNDIDAYGWDNDAPTDQTGVMHPIKIDSANIDTLIPREGAGSQTNKDFPSTVNIYEYYKLSWTANAIVLENYNTNTKMGDLYFYFNYQPWDNINIDSYPNNNIQKVLLMKDVSTFKFLSLDSIMKIQICTKSTLIKEINDDKGYSLCKEKTIF
jgi:hypothetical protein